MSKCNAIFYSNTTMSRETSCTFCTKNSTVFMKIQLIMSNQSNKLEFIKCYNLAFGTNHDTSYNFSNEKLFVLTPAHIYSYLALKVFGSTSPSLTDKPAQGGSSTIGCSKKVISYFIPKKLMKWDFQNNSGNSTKSVKINETITRVKKHVVRREGKASSACCTMEMSEFLEVVERC